MKIIHVVGARPKFMKIAPIIEAISDFNRSSSQPVREFLAHTGQHYDEKMSTQRYLATAVKAEDFLVSARDQDGA